MDIEFLNNLSGTMVAPLFDKLCEKTSLTEVKKLCNLIEFSYKSEVIEELFALIHILVMTSGIEIPQKYYIMSENSELRVGFVHEVIADLEDLLMDYE